SGNGGLGRVRPDRKQLQVLPRKIQSPVTKPARRRGTHRQATQRPVRDDEAILAPRLNDHRLKTVRARRRLIPRSETSALPLKNAVRRIGATRSTITPARGPHMTAR